MKHLLSMNDLTTSEILEILHIADSFAKGDSWSPTQKTYAANLFFEPSTRTKTSFEMAERKIGLDVIPFEAGFCSTTKGESLYDTVRTLESIGISIAVIRHEQEAYYNNLKDRVGLHLVNGGDGCGQHPTQCLLDLLTIQQEFGSFAGLKVAIIGDLNHSRVAKSNVKALEALGAEVVFSGPDEWFLDKGTCNYKIDEIIESVDVAMLLRIQHERHLSLSAVTAEQYHRQHGLTVEREKRMKNGSIIMHPAPVNRQVEIADSLVECERSRIFKQMENGVYVRMAVLRKLLES